MAAALICDTCELQFENVSSCRSHKQSTGHCLCEHCGAILLTNEKLAAHLRSRHDWKCPDCDEHAVFKSTLEKHQRKAGHCCCGDCNRVFSSPSELNMHIQTTQHSTEFRCCTCDSNFVNRKALDKHLKSKYYHSKDPLHECIACNTRYESRKALKQHINSHSHRKIPCISKSCGKLFLTPSGMISHLESGACRSGMNRVKLNQLVLAHDTDRLITKAEGTVGSMLHEVSRRLIAPSPSSTQETDSPLIILSPASDVISSFMLTPEPATPVYHSASSDDWTLLNTEIRCPLCPPTRRPFPTQKALQSHFRSAAHCEPLFDCPSALASEILEKQHAVVRSFKTLSGLAQHLESGKCMGGKETLLQAIRYLQQMLKTWGIELRLTKTDPGEIEA